MLNIRHPRSLMALQKSREDLLSMPHEELVELVVAARTQIDDIVHYFCHVLPLQQAGRSKSKPWPDGVHTAYFEAYWSLVGERRKATRS
jgi:hypothetical protein